MTMWSWVSVTDTFRPRDHLGGIRHHDLGKHIRRLPKAGKDSSTLAST